MDVIDASNSRRFSVSFPRHTDGIIHRHARPLSLYPPIPYSKASDNSVTDGLTKTMLFIGTPLVVKRWRKFIHSWRSWQYHSWSRCGPHCFPLFSKWHTRFKNYHACGITCYAWLISPINDYSVSALFFLKIMPLLCQCYRLFVSLLVGKISESECLCPTLGIFCVSYPPPPYQFY